MRLITRQLTYALLIAAAFSFRGAITEAQTIWTGPDLIISQGSNAGGTVVDTLLPGVEITRGDRGIFINPSQPNQCSNGGCLNGTDSPTGLLFAFSNHGTIASNPTIPYGTASNHASYFFDVFFQSLDQSPGGILTAGPLAGVGKIPGATPTDDIYFDIEVTHWGAGVSGTGSGNSAFTYRRSTSGDIEPPPLPENFAWDSNQSGDWTVSGNWTPLGGPPGVPIVQNPTNHTALFGDVIESDQTVFTNTAVSVRAITFDNTNTYAIAGTGSVNFTQNTASGAPPTAVSVAQGNHQFQAIVQLLTNTTANIATSSTLEFNNRLFLNGHTLTKTGAGTLAINNSVLTGGGTLNCAEGTCGGTGTISGDLNNEGGTISPGNSPVGLSSEGTLPVVPEPATWMLLAIGCAGCLGFRRRRPS